MVEWLAGNRIRGTSAEKPTLGVSGVGGWKEIGRTTLGSTGDSLGVGSLSNKRYLMTLSDLLPSGTIDGRITFNSDTGSNYAYRTSANGGTDATAESQSNIKLFTTSASSNELFTVGYTSNLAGNEKLFTGNTLKSDGTGANDVPKRYENTAKWANTSNAISDVSIDNAGAGDYASGSEVVVLGWDPADTHTTNFWEELASVTLTGTASQLDSGTFTAKKYLWCQIYAKGSGSIQPSIQFNNDTGSNYATRYSSNGSADGEDPGATSILNNTNDGSENSFINFFVVNNSAKEKLMISHEVSQQDAGASDEPSRNETVAKWANTSSQITRITTKNIGTYAIGSIIKVWGSN